MKLSEKPLLRKLFFPVLGFVSLVWFLVRVIPKPSRANYPCMKAAAPLASSFVLWITALVASLTFFKQAKKYFGQARYAIFALSLAAGLVLGVVALVAQAPSLYAASRYAAETKEGPNQPMGKGVGINPGRVVWVHDADATNESCTNSNFDFWFMDNNTNLDVVKTMVAQGLQNMTSTQNASDAWNALFLDFNKKHGKEGKGYTKGEKIVIKINLNGMGNGKKNINTSPQVCNAILDQLVNVVGVAQEDISMGDPNINLDRDMYRICWETFPKVHYYTRSSSRARVQATSGDALFASNGGNSDPLPQDYVDASYLINIPVLKKHHRAGISLAAKNHFGSITPFNGNGAFNWHYSLPVPDGGADNSNGDYGVYRCLVDFMGHKDLGAKTILYLIDGTWSSFNWGHPAIKWRMAPFNNDYPNSLLMSQDPVAIESVGFDFLFAEFDKTNPGEGRYDSRDDHGPFSHYRGVDDYLHQAADKANWPLGLVYDPERDGTPLPDSLGTHEHWNNAADKQYSRNMGKSEGIELVDLELKK